MIHSAIPSWYGYRYQGQLAICYSLLKIKELLEEINIAKSEEKENDLKLKLEKYALEIESFEDFSIRLYKEADNFYYLSAHQVKSGTSKEKIGNEPLFSLIDNIVKNPNCIDENGKKFNMIGYFHVPNEEIVFEDDDFNKIYKEQRKTQIKEVEMILDNRCDWDKLKEKISGQGKKNTTHKIIHDKLSEKDIKKEKKNHNKIIEVINEIKSELTNDELTDEPINIEIFNKMYFKSIGEIEEKIISLVSEIHAQFDRYNQSMSKNTIKRKILPQLIQKLTELIDARKAKPSRNLTIDFAEIYDLIINVPADIDFSYEAYLFRVNIVNGFSSYSEEYCTSIVEDCIFCEDNDKCNLAKFMKDFNGLSVQDVGKLIKNIAVSRDVLSSGQNIPADVDLQNTIFKYLREVEKFKLNKTRISAYHDKKNYWCTCERQISQVKMKHVRNNIVEVLFEADFLIADNSMPGIDVIPIINEFEEKEIETMSKEIKNLFKSFNNSFISTKIIEVIDLSKAKEVLCDE